MLRHTLLRFHSSSTATVLSPRLTVIVLPFSKDNYAFAAASETADVGFLVDPGSPGVAEGALAAAGKEGWSIKEWLVLLTHGHPDHVGGLDEAMQELPGARLVHDEGRTLPAATLAQVPAARRLLLPTDEPVSVDGTGVTLRAIETPFHTDHCRSYHLHDAEPSSPGAVFSGDSLFSGGAGRFPQLEARTALASLDRLSALPDDTALFCGHEYSLTNWAFAQSLEPDNGRLTEAATRAAGRRDRHLPTIPVRLGDERANNPFLRARERSLAKRLGFLEPDPVAVLADVRARKDAF
jgi:hydroxyacylglutathione hydrolase